MNESRVLQKDDGHQEKQRRRCLPIVDWNDLVKGRRELFLKDLRRALSEIGFVVLKNHPDFTDRRQKEDFSRVREFFESSDEIKETSNISRSPYYRGWSRARVSRTNKSNIPPLLAQEAFQYGFECEPFAKHNDRSVPVYKRLFRGPNTWPENLPKFRSSIESLTTRYHRLTHDLGHLICDSIGVDRSRFDEYFPFHDPDLAASLNRNFGTAAIPDEWMDYVKKEFEEKLHSKVTSAHIDGPPFIALLINDRPGLQVIAREGTWINAPVTCRTSEGEYGDVPVVPGAVVVNVGGTLMHLSGGRLVATLHRVNPFLVPPGESRISMPFFLIPRMEGPLIPFFEKDDKKETGYSQDRDRGTNAAVNRMATFPQCTRRWWKDEFAALRKRHEREVSEETQSAYKLARERAETTSKL